MDGEGFIAYLENSKNFGAVQSCWFQFRETDKVKLDLKSTRSIITERNEAVLPFSATICGIRVDNVTLISAGNWTLEAVNINDFREHDNVNIHILPMQKKEFDTRSKLDFGKDLLKCTSHDTQTKRCKIIDETGNLWNGCQLYTTIRSNTTIQCLMYNNGRMQESLEQIIVDVIRDDLYTNASVDENPAAIVMRCHFDDSLHTCQAVMPNQVNEIFITDGLLHGRYSAYDTNTKQSKCAFEILKPLKMNEIGLWRIINDDVNAASGCLFYVGKSKKEIIEEELKKLEDIRTLNAYLPSGDSKEDYEEIECVVPFVIEDCYLRDPNNRVYFPNANKFQRSKLYGKCAFQKLPKVAGVWTCGARGRDYEKEVLQDIQMILKPKSGEVLTDNLKAKSGNTIQLMCRSPFEEPITNCAFIDPNNRTHLVGTTNSIKASGHVQYFGRGIERGECGIKINKITRNDFGQWKCQFNIVQEKVESTFVMQLTESNVGHASSVGLGIGLTVVAVLVLGVIIGTIFYRRRNLTARHSFTSNEPLEMAPTGTVTTETRA